MASKFAHITHESIGANNRRSLESLREKINIAEAGLRNARDQYEAEAVRQGQPVRCIFSGTFFVRRSSAEKWLAEAQHEFDKREAQNFAEVQSALKTLAEKKADNDDEEDPNPYPDDPGDEGDNSPHTPPDKRKKGKKKAAPTDDDVEEAEKAARFFAPVASGNEYQGWVRRGAAAIVAAAAKARGEAPQRPPWELQGNHPKPDLRVIPGAPPPPKGSMARQVIDAGRKARNLPPIDED